MCGRFMINGGFEDGPALQSLQQLERNRDLGRDHYFPTAKSGPPHSDEPRTVLNETLPAIEPPHQSPRFDSTIVIGLPIFWSSTSTISVAFSLAAIDTGLPNGRDEVLKLADFLQLIYSGFDPGQVPEFSVTFVRIVDRPEIYAADLNILEVDIEIIDDAHEFGGQFVVLTLGGIEVFVGAEQLEPDDHLIRHYSDIGLAGDSDLAGSSSAKILVLEIRSRASRNGLKNRVKGFSRVLL